MNTRWVSVDEARAIWPKPRRRSGSRGTRWFGGREYLLCGRGTRESVEREAVSIRRRWRLVRIVPAGPHGRLVDDFMVYVHDNKEGER